MLAMSSTSPAILFGLVGIVVCWLLFMACIEWIVQTYIYEEREAPCPACATDGLLVFHSAEVCIAEGWQATALSVSPEERDGHPPSLPHPPTQAG